jgi:hypothetical protein
MVGGPILQQMGITKEEMIAHMITHMTTHMTNQEVEVEVVEEEEVVVEDLDLEVP